MASFNARKLALPQTGHVVPWGGLMGDIDPPPLYVDLQPAMQNGVCRRLWGWFRLCSLAPQESQFLRFRSIRADPRAVNLTKAQFDPECPEIGAEIF